jgi:hypothetical protein
MGWKDTIKPAQGEQPKSWRDTIVKPGKDIQGIDPSEGLDIGASGAADVVGKGLEQISDLVVNGVDTIPGVGYLKKAQAAVAAPLKGQSYEDTINGYNADTKERWERSPGASATGALLLNPLPGVSGVGTGATAVASKAAANGLINAADAAGRGQPGLDGGGAIIGGLTGVGGSILGDFLPAVLETAKSYGDRGGQWLKGLAESLAVDTLNPILSQQERLNNKGTAQKLGRAMLDEGAVKFGSRVDDIAPRVEDILNREGDTIRAVRKAADAKGATINLAELEVPALANFDKAKGMGTDANNYAEAFAKEVENVNQKPVRSLSETGQLLSELGKSGKYNKMSAPIKVDAVRDVRSGVKSLFDESLANVDQDLFDKHNKARELFSLFSDGDEILQKSVARQDKNAKIGLRDAMAGAAELAKNQDSPEGLLKAARNALISKIVRERGNSAGAVAADKLGNALISATSGTKFEAILREAAKRGPQALVAAHQALSSNPEYQKLTGE